MPNDLQNQINSLQAEIKSLKSNFYYNNFKTTEIKDKKTTFTNGIVLKPQTANPSVAALGELRVVETTLYICTAVATYNVTTKIMTNAAVFTKVGTQT